MEIEICASQECHTQWGSNASQLYLYLFTSQKYLFLDLIPEVVVYGQNYIIYSLCVKLFSIAIYTMYKFSSLGHIALF